MATNFEGKNRPTCPTYLYPSRWHSKTDWNIAKPMFALTAAMIPPHRLKILSTLI